MLLAAEMMNMNDGNEMFISKKKFHSSAAKQTIEEKLKILIELQKIDLSIKKARNIKPKSYEFVWDIHK
jgi:hypothetical protein